MVTLIGTLGVVVGALAFYPPHEFFWGTVVITCFVFSDLIDGTMARMTDRSSRWGAFLDSTLDRVADAAIFGGLALWYAGDGDEPADSSRSASSACPPARSSPTPRPGPRASG